MVGGGIRCYLFIQGCNMIYWSSTCGSECVDYFSMQFTILGFVPSAFISLSLHLASLLLVKEATCIPSFLPTSLREHVFTNISGPDHWD